jgi:hypothetical protein
LTKLTSDEALKIAMAISRIARVLGIYRRL